MHSSWFICTRGLFCFIYNSRLGATIEDLGILDKLLKRNYDRRATPTNHLSKSKKMSKNRQKHAENGIDLCFKQSIQVQEWGSFILGNWMIFFGFGMN